MTIRPLRLGEALRYRDHRLRALQDSPDAFSSTFEAEQAQSEQWWLDRVRAGSADPKREIFIALDRDRFVGSIVVALESKSAHIYAMWIDPGCRRRGFGQSLLAAALSWARDRNAELADLWVTDGNRPAIELYRHGGFAITGEEDLLRPGSKLRINRMIQWMGRTSDLR
ncbi:MAG TPA: GNAT family N-acetyltransferase [Candidatus Binataceae bacterium]|nr:GNAT family N-acetyltransferase [Candidatus Binataceae bacterium]